MLQIETDKPCKIFAEVLEETALTQFKEAMALDCVVKGALMPDAHTGYTLPIGAVIATKNMVFPSMVGYDIGCGMCAMQTGYDVNEIRANSKKIFDQIYRDIPVGFNHNKEDTKWQKDPLIGMTDICREIFDKNGLKQLGTLGTGNHFIEIGSDTEDKVWIIIHSGSRGIGHAVATHYMKLASGDGKAREGFFGLPVTSQEGIDYITDLNFCLHFALANRYEMLCRVSTAINKVCDGNWNVEGGLIINRNHNHAEYKDGLWIHRKGATHAEEGMLGVIPGNMRDGSFIVKGKGNPDSLCSSSHGAGRVLGRKEAERVLSMDNFSATMTGITAMVNKKTLDESPFAYKDIFEVMRLQSDLVDVVAHVKPIINIKG